MLDVQKGLAEEASAQVRDVSIHAGRVITLNIIAV